MRTKIAKDVNAVVGSVADANGYCANRVTEK
jgi:hypothetical protein